MKQQALGMCLTAILTIQLSGCGVLLHPERKGQRGGQVDPAIAVLNAAGLLLFVVPGLIAFGVDLYYGTIYLPGTAKTLSEEELNRLRTVDGQLQPEQLARFVSEQTGQTVHAEEMVSYPVGSVDELTFMLAEVQKKTSS
ncbi:hypothetical protein [Photobacterium halotolerans]|uniref:Uncharacterized protein n=1 Tax=Photobacterium halotolerans TaxID=265726 RepID=A0A7X4WD63_9GAMM|nr:hypothetical protein [Photobacterium halotolerans]NAW66606.1 hypothetical protein [Photobacterium halotolerans]NAX48872.1 hypothetical protein [Photobacterium halotolerans]